jgi:SAM-dependent methyltransferase
VNCICCLSNRIISWPSGSAGYYLCQFCGLIFKENGKENDNICSVINHYQKIDPHEQIAESKIKFFNSALNFLSSYYEKRKRRILDVGCGYGYFLELVKQRGWHGYGVEIMKAAADIAADKVGTNNIFSGRLKEACYPQNSFDAITLWDILFIVDDPFKELQECYRILQHGGTVGIRVRNAFFQQIVYRAYQPCSGITSRLNIKNPAVFHRYCYSSQSIRELLLRVGFRHIRVFNSPITAGDPYKHTAIKELTQSTKIIIDLASKFIFWVSGNRWVVGPSLLIWAEKPPPKNGNSR